MTLAGTPSADEVLVGFSNLLRAAGMAITPDRTSAFVEAVALTGFDDRAMTYWSGRATLCSSLDDNELYDRAFTAWFTDSPQMPRAEGREPAGRVPQAALGDGLSSRSNSGDQL